VVLSSLHNRHHNNVIESLKRDGPPESCEVRLFRCNHANSHLTFNIAGTGGQVENLKGVEVIYPWHFEDFSTPGELKVALADVGLQITSVNPNIWAPEFQNGAFSNPDPAIRRSAIDLCTATADAAREVGCDAMLLWPGQDGYDYPFQADYAEMWNWSVEGYRTLAQYAADIQIAIEYKLREPRVRCIAGSAATTVLIVQATGCGNVGANLDFGHSVQALENAAAVVTLLSEHNRLFNVHINDNGRDWDDDLTVGAVSLAETVEFFRELDKVGYKGWLAVDITPYREDAVAACQLCLDMAMDCQELAERLDAEALKSAQAQHDSVAAQRVFLRALMPNSRAGKDD
jgi:xylose isomerase